MSSSIFGISLFLLFSISPLLCLRFRRDLGLNNNGTQNDFGDSPNNNNNNNQFSSSSDLLFVNNGCEYHNGYIRENGGPPRKATEAEEAQVQAHLRQMEQYQADMQRGLANQMQQMSQQMNEMFAPPFPFGQRQQSNAGVQVPQFQQMPMPQFPCLCDACKRQTPFGGNAANNYNQYSLIGQRGQGMGGGNRMAGGGTNAGQFQQQQQF